MKEDVKQREPETEEDYWEIIEGLGGLNWGMRHSHDYSDGMSQAIASTQKSLEDVVLEMCLKFGVIHPHQPVLTPEGTREYWEWYRGTKDKILGDEYDRTVCSCCPFAGSKKRHIGGNGASIPCSFVDGSHRLTIETASVRCEQAEYNGRWAEKGQRIEHPSSQEDLLQMILDQHGAEPWIRMKERLGMEDLEQTRREAEINLRRNAPIWMTVPAVTCLIDVSGEGDFELDRESEMHLLRAPRDVISVLFDRMVRYYSARRHDRETFPLDDTVAWFSIWWLNDDEGIMVTFDVPFDQAAWEAYDADREAAQESGEAIEPFIDNRFWTNGMFGGSDVYNFLRFVDGDEGDDQDLVEVSRATRREGIHIDEYFFTEEIVSTLLGKD